MYRNRVRQKVRITAAKQDTEQRQKPHICTIKQLAAETGISEYTIRCWVKQGKFKTMRSGRKYLINYAVFMRYVNGEMESEPIAAAPVYGIRKVGAR